MRLPAAIYVSVYCYLYVSAGGERARILPRRVKFVSAYCYMCVRILLYTCPHTAMYVSAGVERARIVALCVKFVGSVTAPYMLLKKKMLGDLSACCYKNTIVR